MKAYSQNEIAKKIIDLVSYFFGIPSKDFVKETCRFRELVVPRQTAMWLMRLFNFSYFQIGSYFDKDHSTVIHSIKQVNNLIDTDKEFRKKVESLKNEILPILCFYSDKKEASEGHSSPEIEYLFKYYLS